MDYVLKVTGVIGPGRDSNERCSHLTTGQELRILHVSVSRKLIIRSQGVGLAMTGGGKLGLKRTYVTGWDSGEHQKNAREEVSCARTGSQIRAGLIPKNRKGCGRPCGEGNTLCMSAALRVFLFMWKKTCLSLV